jgi:hypothetical protein
MIDNIVMANYASHYLVLSKAMDWLLFTLNKPMLTNFDYEVSKPYVAFTSLSYATLICNKKNIFRNL